MKDRFVVLSGCSGGGKSTLLDELRRRGYAVIEEPGRRVVQTELSHGGEALPWLDLEAFARKAIKLSLDDLERASVLQSWVFFDRGLVDAAVALQNATGLPLLPGLSERYCNKVFLVPPWSEIFRTDAERQHSFAEAVAEFERLHGAYTGLGYSVKLIPKTEVAERADFVISEL